VEQERSGGFLPPEPAGPEPELGDGSRREAPAPQPQAPADQPPPAYGWQQQPYPPPPGQGWQGQPAGPPPPPGWQGQPWGYAPAARERDNSPAVAGFVLSLVAGGLLLFSAGLSTIVSIGCAVAGLLYSRKGRQKVDAGETSKNRGLAQAGFIISIVSLALATLATAFWVLILVLALTDDEFQRDLEQEFDDSQSIQASLRIVGAAVRTAGHLLG
jgi:MFS family permease